MNRITDEILSRVEKPVRYIGGELNVIEKDPKSVDIRFAFCFPDVYEVGMSHLGSKILYHTLNQREDTYCERVYAPYHDMEAEMRKNDISLYALETLDPVGEFDIVNFTLQYEMSYTNILNMLQMSGIGLRASERGEDEPIILCGGPCAYNPEPISAIVDIVAMGEGEEMLDDLLDVYKKCKAEGKSKKEFLREASHIEGFYVPSLYTVDYNEDGTIKEFKPLYEDVPAKVKKRIVKNYDEAAYPDKLIVPFTEVVHDRVTLETFRGCTRGCRFCQAGIIYRPVREKKTDTLIDQAEGLLKSTGYDETSLVSLSICDYSDIANLVNKFTERFGDKRIGISLPSIRIDSFSVDLLKEIQKVRKSGLTLAPEAGSQRMRDVINKNVTEEDLVNATSNAFKAGWSRVKLYFIVGLPYETLDDVLGIGDLGNKVVDAYYAVPKGERKKGLTVTLSTSILVPKPFTPFQWAPQERKESVLKKIYALKDSLKRRAINYNWHTSDVSFMEAVVARGDRRISEVIIRAFELGAKFDGWSEYFNFEIWQKAMEDCKVDGEFYAYRERSYDEILPWDFVDVGVTKQFLIDENERAKAAVTSPDCRERCLGCGVNKSFGEGVCFENAILD